MDNFYLSDEQRYRNARKRAKEIRSFYFSLLCYCIVIPILISVNLIYMPEFQWFWFSVIGWGTGLMFHGMKAFNRVPFFGKDWEEKKIREFMEKDRQRNNNKTI